MGVKTYCTGIPRMKMAVESCCAAHDRAYAERTGTRAEADRALYDCLKSTRPIFAWFVYVTVRVFGWLFWRRAP